MQLWVHKSTLLGHYDAFRHLQVRLLCHLTNKLPQLHPCLSHRQPQVGHSATVP